MSSRVILLLFLFSIFTTGTGYKYLFGTFHSIRSEHSLLCHIAEALTANGHDVTFISPYPFPNNNSKVNLVQIPELMELIEKYEPFKIRQDNDMYQRMNDAFDIIIDIAWQKKEVLEVWERRNEFDVFGALSLFSEASFPFLMNFKGSFVQLCTPGMEPMSLSYEGNWISPAVVPNEFMNFWDRSLSLSSTIMFYLSQNALSKSQELKLKKYFPDFKNILNYYDRVVLTLLNSHFAVDGPVPLLPSQVEIGTIHTKKPKPLPKDLEDFVQGSGDAGIIYFSLGSLAKSINIPGSVKEMFIEAFRKIPQKVLWKFDGRDLDLPDSIMTKRWMPQQDILGHPKTRLFISHCGNLGTQEANYHGVPTLGVPILFDQPKNADRMAKKGYGIVLQWEKITTDKIVDAINTLINDTSYKVRLETLSRILKDQKDTPAERAVWWLEYVVRHKGAPHLQYAGKRLSLFQYVMLDVILFWLSVLIVIILSFVYFIKLLCCSSRNQKVKKKKL